MQGKSGILFLWSYWSEAPSNWMLVYLVAILGQAVYLRPWLLGLMCISRVDRVGTGYLYLRQCLASGLRQIGKVQLHPIHAGTPFPLGYGLARLNSAPRDTCCRHTWDLQLLLAVHLLVFLVGMSSLQCITELQFQYSSVYCHCTYHKSPHSFRPPW